MKGDEIIIMIIKDTQILELIGTSMHTYLVTTRSSEGGAPSELTVSGCPYSTMFYTART